MSQWLRNKINGFRQVLHFDNWLQLIIQRLFFPAENLEVYRIGGLHIVSDRKGGDVNGARQLLGTDHYRGLLGQVPVDSIRTVFDLGANNGGFPLLLKLRGAPLQRVLSVEFNPNTFVRLQFNLSYNLMDIGTALNAAVTGESGWLEAEFGHGSTGEGIGDLSRAASSGRARRVRCVTFDELYDAYAQGQAVDLVKIDIEGAEYGVMDSSSATKLSRCRYLLIEIHRHQTHRADRVVGALRQLGLEVLASPVDQGAGNWLFANAAVAPSQGLS